MNVRSEKEKERKKAKEKVKKKESRPNEATSLLLKFLLLITGVLDR